MRLKIILFNILLILYALPVFADDDDDWNFGGGGSGGPMTEETFITGMVFCAVSFAIAFAVIYLIQGWIMGTFAAMGFLKFLPLSAPLMVVGTIPPSVLDFLVAMSFRDDDILGSWWLVIALILLSFLYFYILNILFGVFSDKPYGRYLTRLLFGMAVVLGIIGAVSGYPLVILIMLASAFMSRLAYTTYQKTKARHEAKKAPKA